MTFDVSKMCIFYRETYHGYRCVLMPPEDYRPKWYCFGKPQVCELYNRVMGRKKIS